MGTSTRSSSGVVPIIVIAAIVVGVITGGPALLNEAESAINGVIAQASPDYVVAPAAESLVKQCSTDQILTNRQCGDLKIVVLDAAKMPFIARNIQLAWNAGAPYLLHKDTPGSDQAKRNRVCGAQVFTAQYPDGSCDEYPFASSVEGGTPSVRTEEVPLREQHCQGGSLRSAYRKAGIVTGDAFIVALSHPGNIASSAFAGIDIAKDLSCTS